MNWEVEPDEPEPFAIGTAVEIFLDGRWRYGRVDTVIEECGRLREYHVYLPSNIGAGRLVSIDPGQIRAREPIFIGPGPLDF